MEHFYYDMTVPVFIRSLTALKGVIAKGEGFAKEKGMTEEDMFATRLAPDMLPFVRQIQIASDNAKGTAARVAGVAIPSMSDDEKTFTDLYARIDKTVEFLKTLRPEQFTDAAAREVRLPYFKDRYYLVKDFVPEYGLPNFFFHVVTAYGILRHIGVPIGKADYTGALTAHSESSS